MAIAFSQREAQDTWAHVLERARAELPETHRRDVVRRRRSRLVAGRRLRALTFPATWCENGCSTTISTSSVPPPSRPPERMWRSGWTSTRRSGGPVDDMIISDPSTEPPGVSGRVDASPDRPSSVPDGPTERAMGAPGSRSPTTRSTRSSPDRATGSRTRRPWPSPRRRRRKAYNPLFIYGGVGLGKTHLLFAIGHHMYRLEAEPPREVRDVRAVRHGVHQGRPRTPGRQLPARSTARSTSCSSTTSSSWPKREETQTEFFHTFNHLHTAGRQIVIASDRPPHEICGHGGAPAQQVPMGAVRRRAAARPRDADRDPAAQGGARRHRRPVGRGRVHRVQVRPERP